ncbi:MAG: hypothetical protein JST22_04970 [Bacteroidetes bacterium]|nr:hypothetical protein [Bacteroidota bacterium]
MNTRSTLLGLLFAAVLLCMAGPELCAQLRVTLNVAAHPNPYISAWRTHRETAILTVTNPPGAASVPVKFMVQVKKDGVVQARTKLEKMMIVTIPAGVSTSTYFAEQLFPYEAVDFVGNVDRTAIRTGMLTAGNYEFCVDLVNPSSGASLLGEPVCKPFILTSYQAPVLLQPENASTVSPAMPRPTFRWTPVSPTPPSAVTYRLMVFEVLQGQSAMQAFKSNQPILDRRVTGITQMLWPPDFQLPGRVNTYVWSVRAQDDQGNPIGEPGGYADPFTFTMGQLTMRRADDAGHGLTVDSTGGGALGRGAGGDGNGGALRRGAQEGGAVNGRGADTLAIEGGAGIQQGDGGGVHPDGGNMRQAVIGHGNQNANTDPWIDGNCGLPNPPVITDTAAAPGTFSAGDTIHVGSFAMVLDSATGTGSALTGGGTINVPWLMATIRVAFKNVKVNSGKQLFNGMVVGKIDPSAPVYPQQWAIDIVAPMSWAKSVVKGVDGFLKQNGKIVDMVNQQVQPLMLPLGVNNLKGYTLAITEMKWSRDSAVFGATAAMPISSDNDTLGFVAGGIPFSTGGVAAKGRLDLLSDVTLGAGNPNSFQVTLYKRAGAHTGTFVQWNCSSFDTIGVDLDVVFPRSWLIPSPDTVPGKKVAANFRTKIVDWDDYLISATLPRATIVGTNGLDIVVSQFTYDHSDGRNPVGITFPHGYLGDTTTLFHGFYLKNLTVYLPDKLRTYDDSTQRIAVAVDNMIINNTGLTANFTAKNVLQYPKANVARLGASVDTVKVSIVNSSLTSAYMRGLITLPISDTSKQGALTYKALFSTADSGFTFTMAPTGPIKAKLFADARLTLDSTSTLSLALKRKTSFDLKLNGSFEWADIDIGPVKNVKIATKFQGMGMHYQQDTGMSFAIGTWSFASPPKWIANFPVSIEKVKFTKGTPQGNEALRGSLAFDVVVNLDSNRIGGRSSLAVTGAVTKPAKWYVPSYIGVSVDSIAIYAHLSAVTMNGYVKLYQSDPVMGNGFKGFIKATFNSAQVEVSATALFGTTTYNSPVKYRYWYVDAKAILPPPGIVFLPGYAFYGFGAGAWQRVNVNNMPKPDPAAISAAASNSSNTSSGATFTPDRNVGLGLKLTAVVGTTPDASKLNGDLTLAGQFAAAGGLMYINFNGDIYGMAKLTERANAPVTGNINVNYDFTTKIFHLAARVNINKDPISTPGGINAVVHVEGRTGKWYVKIGEPTARNTIRVAGVNVESYFMFGKDITPPTSFTQTTINGLNSVGVHYTPDAGATNNAIAGNGFAAGVGLNFGTGNRDKGLFGRVKLRWNVGGGFEVNLSMLRYPNGTACSNGASLDGVNKWYTQGSVAAWAIFYCGIHVDPGCRLCYCSEHNHPNGCDFTLASIKLGAYLQGGFPKPTWLEGQASGSFDLLGGLCKGSFTADIDYGTKCTPAGPAETTPGVPAQDAAADQQTALIRSIYPRSNTVNFSRGDRARVLYGFEPNEAFDVAESQGGAAGAAISRTFQARYTLTLRKQDPNSGNWGTPIQIRTVTNDLGERVVVINAPVAAAPPPMQQMRLMVPVQNPVGPRLHPVIYGPGPNNPVENEPQAPPPPDLGPNLDSNAVYQLTVDARLFERNQNTGVWSQAKKRNGQDVFDTRTIVFSTAPPMVVLRMNVGNQHR